VQVSLNHRIKTTAEPSHISWFLKSLQNTYRLGCFYKQNTLTN